MVLGAKIPILVGAFHVNIMRMYKSLIDMLCSRALIIGFMGIPCVGKTTLSKNLSQYFVDAPCFFECEEEGYPISIKLALANRDQNGYLDVYSYFRGIHTENLKKAIHRKKQGQSTIIDCYFDKLLYPLLLEKKIDWFVNSKHADYAEILSIAKKDYQHLRNIDVLIFLSAAKPIYTGLLKARDREYEVDLSIHNSQLDFLKITKDYTDKHHIPLFFIDQEWGVEKMTQKILSQLQDAGLIYSK